jgi:phosphatidylglycerophosphate synthase
MNSAFTIPNLLSVSRGLLAPLAFLAIYQSNYLAASWVLLAALVTDVTDGILARRWQQTSPLGGLLDHGSDAILVSAILAALAFQGYVTPLLPMLVPLAFTQYALDSKALQGRPLQASKIGRYNGILYFIVSGFPILQPVAGLYPLTDLQIMWFSWILVASTLVSMLDRGIALFKTR